jgi:hypothetical protein
MVNRQDEKNTPALFAPPPNRQQTAPNNGTVSLVGGVIFATMFRKKHIDSNTVISMQPSSFNAIQHT